MKVNRQIHVGMLFGAALLLASAAFADDERQESNITTPGYDLALYSTNTCSVAASAGASLTTGTLSLPAAMPSSLEARFRTWLESLGTALKSTKFRHFMVNFR